MNLSYFFYVHWHEYSEILWFGQHKWLDSSYNWTALREIFLLLIILNSCLSYRISELRRTLLPHRSFISAIWSASAGNVERVNQLYTNFGVGALAPTNLCLANLIQLHWQYDRFYIQLHQNFQLEVNGCRLESISSSVVLGSLLGTWLIFLG